MSKTTCHSFTDASAARNHVLVTAEFNNYDGTADVELFINDELVAQFDATDDADPILEAIDANGIVFDDYKDAMFNIYMIQSYLLDHDATIAECKTLTEAMSDDEAMNRVLLHFNPTVTVSMATTREFDRDLDEYGDETVGSIRRHVAAVWGYREDDIKLLEASYHRGVCDWIAFSVNGLGFTTDFRTLAVAPQYDC